MLAVYNERLEGKTRNLLRVMKPQMVDDMVMLLVNAAWMEVRKTHTHTHTCAHKERFVCAFPFLLAILYFILTHTYMYNKHTQGEAGSKWQAKEAKQQHKEKAAAGDTSMLVVEEGEDEEGRKQEEGGASATTAAAEAAVPSSSPPPAAAAASTLAKEGENEEGEGEGEEEGEADLACAEEEASLDLGCEEETLGIHEEDMTLAGSPQGGGGGTANSTRTHTHTLHRGREAQKQIKSHPHASLPSPSPSPSPPLPAWVRHRQEISVLQHLNIGLRRLAEMTMRGKLMGGGREK